jgi:hypothetical protein
MLIQGVTLTGTYVVDTGGGGGGGVPIFTYSGLSQTFINGDIIVTPDGLTVYSSTGASIYVATLANAWDLTSWTPGITYTIPFDMFINHTSTLAFNADGTKIIKIVLGGGYFVSTYNLSTPYDVSTLTGSVTKSTSSLTNLPDGTISGIKFANGGMVGYIVTGDGKVAQYNLASAYDIDSFSGDPDGTADLYALFSLNFFGKPKGFTLNAEGTLGYVTDSGNSYAGRLTQFSLATPYDITTIQTPAIATISDFGGHPGWHGLAINSAGDRLFVVGPNSGATATIFQFNGS